ncbi:GNAT family N-acetyltransferase [Actinokineospora sp. UTMC 2448]|uniref:GNAT family N-acetyltransferase n=1 Tax=Actinokineospora sp. UTMC 2448 TaxID=2268449 RepID=UPI0021648B95|nr:GNAT family N-acetyltransferase [Actinokineospora sp. UTMC 2448]
MTVLVRPAEPRDVRAVKAIIDRYAGTAMLGRDLAALSEVLSDFLVIERVGEVVACGALHPRGGDVGEIASVAVRPGEHGRGVGSLVVECLLAAAKARGLGRVYVLTFQTEFFARHGFRAVSEVPQPVSVSCGRMGLSADDGALFIDLGHAKPNTLGNVRMIRAL